ncbi:MAG: hypothetical protein AAF657_17620, partial [Acidobacteriota bacterium]
MTNRKLVKTLAGSTTLVLVLLATAVVAQEAPFNTTEIGNFDQPGQVYADVWGDGNFAYLAHFGQRVVDIIDISDPANPTLAATYDSNVNSASAQDVKVADGLMFVGLESVTPGCQIVDVRDPFNPVKLTDVTVRSGVHNVFYDEGWLYLVDSSQTQIDVIDLRTYDPDNAPATISDFTWRLTNVGGDFVHDITVKDGRLYASAWDSQRVYNVTDLANQAPIFMGSVPGSSSHASWPTDDGRFLAVAEEHGTGGLTLFEIFDDGITVEFEQRDYYFVSSARAGTVHNPLVVGHRVYASWYAVGVLVLEIDPDTATWDLVASFDTTAADGNSGLFDGCWGVYPFLGEDRVLASDDNNGLWVIDVDPNVLLFRYPNGRPATIQPVTPTPISVEVSSVGAPVAPASVTLHASVDGGPTVDQAMADAGGGLFTANLPAASCGSVVDYSFSADNTLGTEFVDPTGAIGTTYRTRVSTQLTRVFEDTFETDLGWTVNNSAATGAWERDDPNGTGAQPENDFDGDLDDFCFFTGQANPGSSIGNQDVDGGPTTLISPTIDFSTGDGLITYAFWFFTNDEETADDLIVEITNDGASWIPVTRHAGFLGGW